MMKSKMDMKMMSPRKRMDMEGSGPTKKMAMGGSACGTKSKKMMAGGMTKGYAKGGVTRADGVCMKGHTKGKMV
jgi:hypothetical protein